MRPITRPILIYPNPLNPERYVVLNSGFTFREHAYMSNALQIPKLPDWAIVDVRTPPDGDWPGKIAAADFFDEEWQVRPARGPNESCMQSGCEFSRDGRHRKQSC